MAVELVQEIGRRITLITAGSNRAKYAFHSIIAPLSLKRFLKGEKIIAELKIL